MKTFVFVTLTLLIIYSLAQDQEGSGTGTGTEYQGSGTGSSTGDMEQPMDSRLVCIFNCAKQINTQDYPFFEHLFQPQNLQTDLVSFIDQHGSCFSDCLQGQTQGSEQGSRRQGSGTQDSGSQ